MSRQNRRQVQTEQPSPNAVFELKLPTDAEIDSLGPVNYQPASMYEQLVHGWKQAYTREKATYDGAAFMAATAPYQHTALVQWMIVKLGQATIRRRHKDDK